MKAKNLSCDTITNNKKKFKTINTFFTNKGLSTTNITLIDNNKIVSTDQEVAETLNFLLMLYHLYIFNLIK